MNLFFSSGPIMEYDDVVVGGGSAGSLLAARLSEDSERRVLLLEAGRDYPSRGEIPAELLDSNAAVMSGHNWELEAYVREESAVNALQRASGVLAVASSRGALVKTAVKSYLAGHDLLTRFNYPLGKVIGGGSSVNGALAFRGAPEDYEEWAAAGNDWWSWEKVSPCLDALEDQQSNRGALPIETAKTEDYTTLQRDFVSVCRGLGFPAVDLRRETGGGVGSIPKNVENGQRISAALAFLSPARSRQNLTIVSSCIVDKLIFDESKTSTGSLRVRGVDTVIEAEPRQFFGTRVYLTAGAIHSPAILMRSGIGAHDEVRKLGVNPRIDLPAVGKNLRDHAVVAVWAVPKEGVCGAQEPVHQAMLRHTARGSGYENDLHLYMLNAVRTEMFPPLSDVTGSEIALAVSAFLAKPESTGRLEITSRRHDVSPIIFLNCGREHSDLERLVDGVRLAWRILQEKPLNDKIQRFVMWNQNIIDSDQQIEKLITSTVRGSWHPSGTLRMGPETDPMAAVDQFGRVRGCQNLRVADASIMPTIPRAPINLTCMMIGERIAAHARQEHDSCMSGKAR